MTQEDSRAPAPPAPRRRLSHMMSRVALFAGISGLVFTIWLFVAGPLPREAVVQSRLRAEETAALVADAVVEAALKTNRSQIGASPNSRRRSRQRENENFEMEAAAKLLRRMSASSGMRIRLYDDRAMLILDSESLSASQVVAVPLSRSGDAEEITDARAITPRDNKRIATLLKSALRGTAHSWAGGSRENFVILAAEPVQRLKRIRGGVVVMRHAESRGGLVASGTANRLSPYMAGFVGLGLLAALLSFGLLRPLRRMAGHLGTGGGDIHAIAEAARRAGETLERRRALLEAMHAPVAALRAAKNTAAAAQTLNIIALASDIDKAALEPRSAVDLTALLKAIEGETAATAGRATGKSRVRGVRVQGREAVLRPLLHFLSLCALHMAGKSARVHLDARGAGDDAVHITIDDNGAPPKTPDIDGWFARLNSDTAPLGAQIARRGVEAHNGRISAKAHEGGARLTIALPA